MLKHPNFLNAPDDQLLHKPMLLTLLFVLSLSLPKTSFASQIEQYYNLQIEQQALSSALIELGYQTGISIIFDKSITEGKHAKKLNGIFSIKKSLNKILAGNGLKYAFINEETVSVQQCEIDECIIQNPDTENVRQKEHTLPTRRYMDEVVSVGRRITGSRIRRTDINGISPVDILTLEDIEVTGAQSVSDVLKYLPAVAGNSTSTFVTNGGDGTSSVALRGLPTTNTLVLVNGKRAAPGSISSAAVDLNTIPFPAIERIEVLKEGASAIYGTDAIAGVVNIIMKNEFDGFDIEAFYGSSDRSDLTTSTIKFVYGLQLDKGNLIISGNWFDQGEIYSRNREISADADSRNQGGANLRSSATPFPRITLSDDYLILERGFDGSDPSHFREADDEDVYNYREQTYAYVPSTQENLYIHNYYNLSDKTNFYLDVIYSKTHAENQLASVPLTNFQGTDVTVSSNNIYNPFGVDIADFRRRMTELGPRSYEFDTIMYQASFGIEQSTKYWDWDLGYNKSQNESTETSRNLLDAMRVQRALGDASNCQGLQIDGCVPLNVFGPPDSITDEQISYLSATTQTHAISTLEEISANIIGDAATLKTGAIKLAAGINHRKEVATILPDTYTETHHTIGGANKGRTNGERNINEFYIELLAPIYKNKEFKKGLDLELAARYSDYSDFGSISNPKIGLKYYPTENLLLRMTYSRGFRAPSLTQLYSEPQQSFDRIDDPCHLSENISALPGCTQLADETRSQFLTLKGGNESLLPETSKNYTAGLVWESGTATGISATLDLYIIEQKNVVDSSAQFVVDQNANYGILGDRVIRDANGNLIQVNATFLNIGRREITGADFTFSYTTDETEFGEFKYAFNAAHIRRYLDQIDPTAERTNLAGTFSDAASEGNGALPKWKYNLGLSWSKDFWLLAYTVHHIDAIKESIPFSNNNRKIRSWTVHDAQISTYIAAMYDTRLTFGINNIFNKAPPFAASAFNDNIDARTYDLTGRFLYLKLSKEF